MTEENTDNSCVTIPEKKMHAVCESFIMDEM